MPEKTTDELTLDEALAVLNEHRAQGGNYMKKIVAVYDHNDPNLITTLLLDETSSI